MGCRCRSRQQPRSPGLSGKEGLEPPAQQAWALPDPMAPNSRSLRVCKGLNVPLQNCSTPRKGHGASSRGQAKAGDTLVQGRGRGHRGSQPGAYPPAPRSHCCPNLALGFVSCTSEHPGQLVEAGGPALPGPAPPTRAQCSFQFRLRGGGGGSQAVAFPCLCVVRCFPSSRVLVIYLK